MSEPEYKYVKGEGWVVSTPPKPRTLNKADFQSYMFNDWVCVNCKLSPGYHYYNFDGVLCCAKSVVPSYFVPHD